MKKLNYKSPDLTLLAAEPADVLTVSGMGEEIIELTSFKFDEFEIDAGFGG